MFHDSKLHGKTSDCFLNGLDEVCQAKRYENSKSLVSRAPLTAAIDIFYENESYLASFGQLLVNAADRGVIPMRGEAFQLERYSEYWNQERYD